MDDKGSLPSPCPGVSAGRGPEGGSGLAVPGRGSAGSLCSLGYDSGGSRAAASPGARVPAGRFQYDRLLL